MRATDLPQDHPAAAPAGAGIFRAQALDGLATPDRIDLAAAVVRPASWLLLAAACLSVGVLIAGLVLVTVPLSTTAPAVFLAPGGLLDLRAAGDSAIGAVVVREGAHVEPGAVLLQMAGGATLNAPVAGIVTDLREDAGDRVAAGTVLAVVAADAPAGTADQAAVFLDPALAGQVRQGMLATLSAGNGATRLSGRILWVADRPVPAASLRQRMQTAALVDALPVQASWLEARVALDQPDPTLRGLPATASVVLRRQTLLAMLLPSLALAFQRDRSGQ